MKNRNYYIHHKLIIVLIFLFPFSSLAAVKEVTLFPNSAKIMETAKIKPQCDRGKCKAVVTLPPQADPESFVVSLAPPSRVKIEDVQIKPIQVQDETRIAELRKKIATTESEKKKRWLNYRPSKHRFNSGRRRQKKRPRQSPILINWPTPSEIACAKPVRKNLPLRLNWKKSKKILKNFRKN